MAERTQHKAEAEANHDILTPLADLRWVQRFVPVFGPNTGTYKPVLQQAFRRPGSDRTVWRDVPTVNEGGEDERD